MPDDGPLTPRRRFLGGIGAAGAAALAGCSANARTPPGDHLRLGTLYPPLTLDPVAADDVGSARVIRRLFDGLYTYDRATNLVPQIAAGMPTVGDGGRTVTVRLKRGPRFHDGRPVTAEDVKYSFEAPAREDAPTRWRVDMIDSIETPDDRTVRFRLEYPYPAFDHSLLFPIVPRHARADNEERFATEPIGAGPFELRTFSEERRAEVVRWDGYWGEPTPNVAAFTSAYVESPITRMMSLKTNRNDLIEPVSPLLWERFGRMNGVSRAATAGYTSYYVGFNLNEGPTTDPTVRKAISHCLDADKAVAEFVGPAGERQHSILPPRVAEAWNLPTEEWADLSDRKNTERARRLFRQADSASGQLKILASKDPQQKEFAEAIAGGLRDAGRGALVESLSWKKYFEKYASGAASDYSIFVGSVAGTPDPDTFVYPVFHENMAGATNAIFYREDDVMTQIMDARRTTDDATRRNRYRSAITALLEDRAFLPLCSFKNSFGVDATVRGFEVYPIARLNPRITAPSGAVSIDNE